MKILVIGGGGREHAILWKLSQSPLVDSLWALPGNGGIANIATCVPIKVTEIEKIVAFVGKETFDLVVVAPDDPLALGLVDCLEAVGVKAFGPSKAAAQIEASKAFSKNFMKKYNIPTANYALFHHLEEALTYIQTQSYPLVVKASGLALGKGVIIALNHQEAKTALESMMTDKIFGEAGQTVVIEEFLQGSELTVLAFTDGKTIKPMINSRDHKRCYDGDQGLNTGGMGAITPGEFLTAAQEETLMNTIFLPTVEGLREENIPFKGVLYFGLMLTANGPKVIEYNARFGDPETQAILPRLENDLVEIFLACIEETLADISLHWSNQASCNVVMASGGYPEKYTTGYPITGLEKIAPEEAILFHSGTIEQDKHTYLTHGGRVLSVTALGKNIEEAIQKAYAAIAKIDFKDHHFRKDIGGEQ